MNDGHRALILLIGGSLVLLISWLPMLLKRVPLSLPIICLAIGYGASFTPVLHVTSAADLATTHAAETICEI